MALSNQLQTLHHIHSATGGEPIKPDLPQSQTAILNEQLAALVKVRSPPCFVLCSCPLVLTPIAQAVRHSQQQQQPQSQPAAHAAIRRQLQHVQNLFKELQCTTPADEVAAIDRRIRDVEQLHRAVCIGDRALFDELQPPPPVQRVAVPTGAEPVPPQFAAALRALDQDETAIVRSAYTAKAFETSNASALSRMASWTL